MTFRANHHQSGTTPFGLLSARWSTVHRVLLRCARRMVEVPHERISFALPVAGADCQALDSPAHNDREKTMPDLPFRTTINDPLTVAGSPRTFPPLLRTGLRRPRAFVRACRIGALLAGILLPMSAADAVGTSSTTAQKNLSGSISTFKIIVPSRSPWYDTGIDVPTNTQILIKARGTVRFGPNGSQVVGPNGGDKFGGTTFDPKAVYPKAVVVSLIGKTGGTKEVGTGTLVPEGVPGKGMGFVGAVYGATIAVGGRLFLGFNDENGQFFNNSGSFTVTVRMVAT